VSEDSSVNNCSGKIRDDFLNYSSNNDQIAVLVNDPNNVTVLVSGLDPFTSYTFYVLAVTIAPSEPSNNFTVLTDEAGKEAFIYIFNNTFLWLLTFYMDNNMDTVIFIGAGRKGEQWRLDSLVYLVFIFEDQESLHQYGLLYILTDLKLTSLSILYVLRITVTDCSIKVSRSSQEHVKTLKEAAAPKVFTSMNAVAPLFIFLFSTFIAWIPTSV